MQIGTMTNEELLREIEILKNDNAQLRALTGWTADCETFDWKHLNHIVSNYENNGEFTTKLRARITHCMQQQCRHLFNGELAKIKRELARIPAECKSAILNYSCHKSLVTPLDEVFADHNLGSNEKITNMVELLLHNGAIATNSALQLACSNNVYGAALLLIHRGAKVCDKCILCASAPDVLQLLHVHKNCN